MRRYSGVSPDGEFIWGVHTPSYRVKNLRQTDREQRLGSVTNQPPKTNAANFPHGDVDVENADQVFEIPNALPFRGATYITASWAEPKALRPELIALPKAQPSSMTTTLEKGLPNQALSRETLQHLITVLPEPIQLAMATTSTDVGQASSANLM